MMRDRFGFSLLLLLMVGALSASWATEARSEDDLNLIPESVLSIPEQIAATPAPGNFRIKTYLDEALAASFKRHDTAVPLPDGSPETSWNNRMSLDMQAQMILSPCLTLIVADRLNHLSDDDRKLSGASIQNDLKEFYLTSQPFSSFFLDVGRINIRNGVALGFNPTDYFKKSAISSRISEDPVVLRENRLGAVMVRAQGIWEKGAVSLALAPQVPHDPNQWHTDSGSAGLELARTNDRTRFLTRITLNAFEDLNPEFLYFFDSDRSHLGINITKGVGDALVFYGEWSGANRENLISQSMAESWNSNVMDLKSPRFLSGNAPSHFQNQLSVGFSYTETVNRTTHVEYHFNEAGFSSADWDQWFDTGIAAEELRKHPDTAAMGMGLLAQLWIPRIWAREAQEPASRHSLFIRTHWRDAMVNALDLTGIAEINLTDGGFFVQPMAEYHFQENWSLSLTLNLFIGARESEYGSLNPMGDLKAGATYYF